MKKQRAGVGGSPDLPGPWPQGVDVQIVPGIVLVGGPGPLPSDLPRLGRPRLLDLPCPGLTVEEQERQRQKDVEALVKILEGRGVHRRLLYRCRARTAEGVCDAYRVSGEFCVACGDGLLPRTA